MTLGGGHQVRYEYDAAQQRVLTESGDCGTPGSQSCNQRIYAGGGYERHTARDGSGAFTKHLYKIFAGSRQVAQVEREVRAGTTDETRRYLHADHLGSSQLLTDEDGEVASLRRFTPFGELRDAPSGDSAAASVRAGFTGHEQDLETGLVNMGGRIYDPRLGRFLQADPPFMESPFFSQGLNRYAYVSNNPLNLVDPIGFEGLDIRPGDVVFPDDPLTGSAPKPQSDGQAEGSPIEIIVVGTRAPAAAQATERSAESYQGQASAMSEAAQGESAQAGTQPASQGEQWASQGGAGPTGPNDGSMGRGHSSEAPSDGGDLSGFLLGGAGFLPGPLGAAANSADLARATIAGDREGMVVAAFAIVVGGAIAKGVKSALVAKGVLGITGRVATRINLSNEGMQHVLNFHLNAAKAVNKSQFFGSEATVRGLLSAKSTIQAPVRLLESGNFARTVTNAGPVGTLPGKIGGGVTNVFTVISDEAGNLLSAFPGTI